MTLDEFLDALAETPRTWQFFGRWIRTERFSRGYRCPLTAVCAARGGRAFSVGDWDRAGDALGLDADLATRIVNAADGRCEPDLRARLLAAVDLIEGINGG